MRRLLSIDRLAGCRLPATGCRFQGPASDRGASPFDRVFDLRQPAGRRRSLDTTRARSPLTYGHDDRVAHAVRAGEVARMVHEFAGGDHRGRAAAVEVERVAQIEARAQALEVGERHAYAVVGFPAVDRGEPDEAAAV